MHATSEAIRIQSSTIVLLQGEDKQESQQFLAEEQAGVAQAEMEQQQQAQEQQQQQQHGEGEHAKFAGIQVVQQQQQQQQLPPWSPPREAVRVLPPVRSPVKQGRSMSPPPPTLPGLATVPEEPQRPPPQQPSPRPLKLALLAALPPLQPGAQEQHAGPSAGAACSEAELEPSLAGPMYASASSSSSSSSCAFRGSADASGEATRPRLGGDSPADGDDTSATAQPAQAAVAAVPGATAPGASQRQQQQEEGHADEQLVHSKLSDTRVELKAMRAELAAARGEQAEPQQRLDELDVGACASGLWVKVDLVLTDQC